MNPAPDNPIAALEQLLGPDGVHTSADARMTYGRDWTRFYEPSPLAVVFPKDIETVQSLVEIARTYQLGLVPSGGRTGLSGGAVAIHGELVVSFDRMNRVLEFDATNRTVVCQPGVVTAELQAFAEENDLMYPVDFAAAGSSQIGGNIATNAGGINVIRYGMTREWVAGLKVVTGTGEVLDLNRGLVKNNTGMDLRHLFIGSEGILGFVVEATMQLTERQRRTQVIVLAVPELERVMTVLTVFQKELALTAFEFFSDNALEKVIEHAGVQRPVDTQTPFYVLVEFECEGETEESIALAAFERCFELECAVDGVMSRSRDQARSLWRCREDISETISRWTPYKNDVSVTVSKVPEFLRAVDEIVSREYPDLEIVWFGHIGDGNLHLNILKPEHLDALEFKARCDQVSPLIFSAVQSFGGSVSAEHGIGLLKKDYLNYTRSAAEIASMRSIKRIFDPDGILNPGKVFDP